MVQRSCFIISPIGDAASDIRKKADDVLRFIVEPGLEGTDVHPVRSDQIREPGRISEQMFERILTADVCVVVMTGQNPNVYYELAVAQCAGVPTILLLERGDELRFDVQDLRAIEYDLTDPNRVMDQVDAKSLRAQLDEIAAAGWRTTSLFNLFDFGPNLPSEDDLINFAETHRATPLDHAIDDTYTLSADDPRTITIVTGSVVHIGDVGADVIVSSENTDLQLAQFYDTSISGTLRFLDAQRSKSGQIEVDSLQQGLGKTLVEEDYRLPVLPGTVVATPTNGLKELGLQYVLHAAIVQGNRRARVPDRHRLRRRNDCDDVRGLRQARHTQRREDDDVPPHRRRHGAR